MSSIHRRLRPFHVRRAALLLAACAWLPSAHAGLGGDAASIAADQAKLRATALVARATPQYEVHELHTPQGTAVRQFVAPGGKVFGVAWSGPSKPDLRVVLGSHYDEYTAMHLNQARTQVARNIRSLRSSALVVEFGGHMRAYWGRAYLPTNIPASVKAVEIQ